MSNYTKNYNDSMIRFAENISKMMQSVQEIYTSQPTQKMAEAFRVSVPKVYFNQNTLNGMTKLAGSLSKSSFANMGNKDLYEALQKNFASQMKVFKQENFRKLGEKIRQSMPDIDVLSSNLQRAADAIQAPEYSNSDEIDDEIYNAYSSDIEQILAGELKDEEIVERNEKSEGELAKLLYKIIAFIATTFFAGYIQYASGPVYELMNKVVVKEDMDDLAKEIGTPTKGTKVTVWAKKDGYVEISYEDESGNIQGYISENDFNNKSQLVQDALDEEQLSFISK